MTDPFLLDEHRHSGLRQCPERNNPRDGADIGHRFLQRVRLLSHRTSLLLHGRYVSEIAANSSSTPPGHSKNTHSRAGLYAMKK